MALLVAVPFLVVVSAFVILGTASISRATGSAFSAWLKDAGRVARFVLGPTAELGVALARWITHQVGAEWKDLERLGVTWLGALAQWAEQVIVGALLWPYELSRFAYWLLDVEIPRLLRAAPHAATQIVQKVYPRVRVIERQIVRFPKLSRAQAKALVAAAIGGLVVPYLPMLRWLRSHYSALTHAIPHVITLPKVPSIVGLRKRVSRLERLLAVGLGVAIVARAIARMGIGWIRCRKVGQVGRQICGIDDNLLESLLGDAVAIFSVLSVVEFAKELQALEGEAIGIMGKLVREWPS